MDDNRIALHYLDNLPRHIEDAPSCSAEEAPQACDGTTSDHSSADRLSLPIQQPPPLFPLLSLLQLQLPLFLMVAQPNLMFLLHTETVV